MGRQEYNPNMGAPVAGEQQTPIVDVLRPAATTLEQTRLRRTNDRNTLGKVALGAGSVITLTAAAVGSHDTHAQHLSTHILERENTIIRPLGASQMPSSAAFDARVRFITADDEPEGPTPTPVQEEPTPVPTPIETPAATATPEQQRIESYAYKLSDVKTTVTPINGFRIIATELSDRNKKGGPVSQTLNFTARQTSTPRTNSISPEHEKIQTRSAQASQIYANIIDKLGTSREKANLQKVIEAQSKATAPIQRRTSADMAAHFRTLYALSVDDPDSPTPGASLLSFQTAVASTPQMPNVVENYMIFSDNATKSETFGDDVYWHWFNVSVDVAQIAFALNTEENMAATAGFNPAAGADGVDGRALEAATHALPERMAITYKVAEGILNQLRNIDPSTFTDPTGEMARFTSQWETSDIRGKVILMGNILGKGINQISQADIDTAIALINIE